MTDQEQKTYIPLLYKINVIDNVGYLSTFNIEAQDWTELGTILDKRLRKDETVVKVELIKKGRSV